MRRILSVIGILAVATTLVAAQAATKTTTKTQTRTTTTAKSATGTIDTFANNVLTVKTAKGSENFNVTADTVITKSAKKVDATALTASETVKVRYTEAAGAMTATAVTISAAKPATTPKKK
jgi:FKBP-type peptidyl-prolyl cis-trans isomerase